MLRVFCLVFGYVFGLFQTGYLYGRMNHIDIRNYGSGNSGTTNALRVLGKKAGLIVFIGDLFKAIIISAIVHVVIGHFVSKRGVSVSCLCRTWHSAWT